MCERCGSYACEACRATSPTLCAKCAARFGAYVVPFDDDPGLASFFATLKATLFDHRAFFSRLPSARPARAVRYVLLAALLSTLPVMPITMVGPLVATGLHAKVQATARMCGVWGGNFVGTLVMASVGALLFHLAARMLGGHATLSGSFRATSFAVALYPLHPVFGQIGHWLPPMFIVELVFQLAICGLASVSLYRFAVGGHRLAPLPAAVAASAPLFAFLFLLLAAGLLVVLYGVTP